MRKDPWMDVFSVSQPASCGTRHVLCLFCFPAPFHQAMAPVKKALGADPEVVEARESLAKYKAKLSMAVVEVAATAATRCVTPLNGNTDCCILLTKHKDRLQR